MANNKPFLQTLISVDFVVHGRVQGVFFRKFTAEKALALDLVGNVRNVRSSHSVAGLVQGARGNVNQMKTWLETTGSPSSRVEWVAWGEERVLEKVEFDGFHILPTTDH